MHLGRVASSHVSVPAPHLSQVSRKYHDARLCKWFNRLATACYKNPLKQYFQLMKVLALTTVKLNHLTDCVALFLGAYLSRMQPYLLHLAWAGVGPPRARKRPAAPGKQGGSWRAYWVRLFCTTKPWQLANNKLTVTDDRDPHDRRTCVIHACLLVIQPPTKENQVASLP